MRFCIAAMVVGALGLAAWASAAEAQSLTRVRPVFPSNFSRTFTPSPHYGGFSNPSNYGYYNRGSLENPWSAGLYSGGYSGSSAFAASNYGLSGSSLNFAPSPINPGAGLLPFAPGGAVSAPAGTPTLTPGETIRAGSGFPRH
ncbi:MAG TPA: hypothetical protein VIK18_14970 [Pirellulales bacterium]